jgi:hypothetical protein
MVSEARWITAMPGVSERPLKKRLPTHEKALELAPTSGGFAMIAA